MLNQFLSVGSGICEQVLVGAGAKRGRVILEQIKHLLWNCRSFHGFRLVPARKPEGERACMQRNRDLIVADGGSGADELLFLPGFSTREVLITGIDLTSAGYDARRARRFQDELMTRVQALPGVESAAYARVAPFSYRTYSSAPLLIEGYQATAGETVEVLKKFEAAVTEAAPLYKRAPGCKALACTPCELRRRSSSTANSTLAVFD